MLSLFQRKRLLPAIDTTAMLLTEPPKGLVRPESAASLLSTPRRQRLLEHIWQRTSLSRTQFASLYWAPLERYAELVQLFHASESNQHAMGRASCRTRVCPSGEISVVAVSLKKKKVYKKY